MSRADSGWRLNSFLDTLILELDRAQDTLALKGINRRLTYTVRDLSLDLQLFPEFDGRELRFKTAGPGETGAARIGLQLGSITDRQIRETTREPLSQDDVSIAVVDGIDDDTRHELQKIGVSSVADIERMEQRNVDFKQAGSQVDYRKLANIIQRSRRRQNPPAIARAALVQDERGPALSLLGSNLSSAASVDGFPAALLNGAVVPVLSATAQELRLALPEGSLHEGPNELRVALDPYAVMTLDVNA